MTPQDNYVKSARSSDRQSRDSSRNAASRNLTSNPSSRHQQPANSKSPKSQLAVTAKGRTKHLELVLSEGNFIAFDIETTGGNPEKNGMTEIFALRYHKGQIVDTFYTMVNPGISIPPIVRRMTGITNRMVKDAPRVDEIMQNFVDFIGDDVLVSHNTIGDMKFLRYFSRKVTGQMITNYYLCTHLLVEKLVSHAPDKSLKGLAQFFSLLSDRQLHRAEADAYLTLELFKVLLDKLQEKGIDRIIDAIRFQGDYESGTRLGWGISSEVLNRLPQSSGVFYLYDFLGNITFLSAAHNIAREVKKLQRFSLLPRQLLKSVLASTEVRFTETSTAFAAALAEAEGIHQHGLRFDPANWHQRTANFLYVRDDGQQFRFGTGPLGEDVVLALGPIRGGREVTLLMEHLARVFQKKISKKGLRLSHREGRLALDFLNGRRIEPSFWDKARELFSFLQKDESMDHIKAQLQELSIPLELSNLETCSGILAVPNGEGWHIYTVASGIPQDEMILQGDLVQSLKEQNLHVKIYKKLKLAIYARRKGPRPLPLKDTLLINRTFWWAFFGSRHEDVRVIPIEELARI